MPGKYGLLGKPSKFAYPGARFSSMPVYAYITGHGYRFIHLFGGGKNEDEGIVVINLYLLIRSYLLLLKRSYLTMFGLTISRIIHGHGYQEAVRLMFLGNMSVIKPILVQGDPVLWDLVLRLLYMEEEHLQMILHHVCIFF